MRARDLVVIASHASGSGFALAGIDVVAAADAKEAANALEDLEEKVNVVVIDERLYDGLSEEVRRSLNRATRPVVIPVPGPDWTDESRAHEYIVQILRRAIGYRVRLQ